MLGGFDDLALDGDPVLPHASPDGHPRHPQELSCRGRRTSGFVERLSERLLLGEIGRLHVTTVTIRDDGVNRLSLLTAVGYGRNVRSPLTEGTANGARGMAVELLTYANREKVAQALTAQGYEVTRQTVNRWARGDEMPAVAAQMIARLFGHNEEAAPGVPERLNKIDMYLRAIATAAGVPIAELEKIEESHRLVQGITPGRRRSGATRP